MVQWKSRLGICQSPYSVKGCLSRDVNEAEWEEESRVLGVKSRKDVK